MGERRRRPKPRMEICFSRDLLFQFEARACKLDSYA
jgi:hypothetical protein